jgi:NADH-quinone oxidoreductase subunit N
MPHLAQDLITILPELTLAVGGMALLIFGLFFGEKRPQLMSALAIALFAAAAVLILRQPMGVEMTAFGREYVADDFTRFAKLLVLLGAALSLVLAAGFMIRERIARFEFPVLVVFATLGMMMMVSAGGLMALYVGLELQSLALYVLAAFHRDNAKATEAGLKYFVLGALSSGLLLYGSSLIYGYAGTVSFDGIAAAAGAALSGPNQNVGFLIGLVFVLAGLSFKVSAVPFHMWTPDVYEGAPTPVTAFFATAPKVAAMALIVRVLFEAFPGAEKHWQQILVFVALASMLLGSFAAIGQTNIKRLMAYSSIGNVGYMLAAIATGTELGAQAVLLFLTIYVVTTIATFVCILAMRRAEGQAEGIDDLSGLMGTQPLLAICLIVLMFSYVGIPPLPGFFGKFFVFGAVVQAGLWPVAIIGVLASVVAAFYYVRIVMLMINGEPSQPFVRELGGELRLVLAGTMAFALSSVLFIGILLGWAGTAAKALGAS